MSPIQNPIQTPPKFKAGKVRLREASGGEFPLQCVATAIDSDGRVMLLSAVGAATSVKAFSAALVLENSRAYFQFEGLDVTRIVENTTYQRHADSYDIRRVRLQGHWWHMLAIAKDERLISAYSDAALWDLLCSNKFTTPLIPEWKDHVIDKLATRKCKMKSKLYEEDALERCRTFRCSCAVLNANDDLLDDIVSSGLKDGSISIPA